MCTTRAGAAPSLSAEDAVAEPEVQRRADHDDEVGLRRTPDRGPGSPGSGWPAGRMPRPMPLAMTGRPSDLDEPGGGVLGAVGPDVRPEHQHRVLRASPSSAAISCRSSGSGSSACRAARRGAAVSARLKSWSMGTSRNTGPRCGSVASRNAAPTIGTVSATSRTVAGSLVTGASIGGWSSSCSAPLPQRNAGARPPSTTTGTPLKWALVTAETPLVTPGPAVRTARPGRAGQLGGGLGGEDGGLLVAYVDQRHRAARP